MKILTKYYRFTAEQLSVLAPTDTVPTVKKIIFMIPKGVTMNIKSLAKNQYPDGDDITIDNTTNVAPVFFELSEYFELNSSEKFSQVNFTITSSSRIGVFLHFDN